jgi:hypothetical protein
VLCQALLTMVSVVLGSLGPAIQLQIMAVILLAYYHMVSVYRPFNKAQLHNIHSASVFIALMNALLLTVICTQPTASTANAIIIIITLGNMVFIPILLITAVQSYWQRRRYSRLQKSGDRKQSAFQQQEHEQFAFRQQDHEHFAFRQQEHEQFAFQQQETDTMRSTADVDGIALMVRGSRI